MNKNEWGVGLQEGTTHRGTEKGHLGHQVDSPRFITPMLQNHKVGKSNQLAPASIQSY